MSIHAEATYTARIANLRIELQAAEERIERYARAFRARSEEAWTLRMFAETTLGRVVDRDGRTDMSADCQWCSAEEGEDHDEDCEFVVVRKMLGRDS